MTLSDVAMTIAESATGANGTMSDAQIIDRAASELVDIVYEGLAETEAFMDLKADGNININQEQLAAIRRMVARAMLRQFQRDEEELNEVLARPTETSHAEHVNVVASDLSA